MRFYNKGYTFKAGAHYSSIYRKTQHTIICKQVHQFEGEASHQENNGAWYTQRKRNQFLSYGLRFIVLHFFTYIISVYTPHPERDQAAGAACYSYY